VSRHLTTFVTVAVLAATAAWLAPKGAFRSPREGTFLSETYLVDRKYKSMDGPMSTEKIHLGDPDARELLWVTGYKAVMVGPDGWAPAPQEFMCHTNLDVDREAHRARMGWKKRGSPRLFTLSQGQFEIRFPPGFGLPVWSDEPLQLTTQVLNHNIEGERHRVRHRVTVDFTRDADLRAPLEPLFSAYGHVLAVLSSQPKGAVEAGHSSVGCLVREDADPAATYIDRKGIQYTGHWVVPPGREVNRTDVTAMLSLPFDTTVHYIAAHLHPFAESLELRDLTTGKTVFKSKARNESRRRIGLAYVEYFSSKEGLPLYKDRRYELVSVYDNKSGAPQDSMAAMFLYLADREFKKG